MPPSSTLTRDDSDSFEMAPTIVDPRGSAPTVDLDLEKAEETSPSSCGVDIEHQHVENDPRKWSRRKKSTVLFIISFAAMCGTLSTNIFFPSLASLQIDLSASDNLIAATASLFILFLGVIPMVWTAISEVLGRKLCYMVSFAIYIVASIVCSQARSIGVFLAMRVLQAIGCSSVLAVGAGTLADIYDTHERGGKLGIYYAAPLLGPSLGPILGGGLTQGGGWRTTFYFLVGYGVLCLALFLWLPETYRKERSLAARAAARRAALSDGRVRIRLSDINPLSAVGQVLRQRHNLVTVSYSGFLFAAQYSVTYTVSRTFQRAPYEYSSLKVGLVLLSFGVGNLLGSICSGHYSDIVLKKLTTKNGGKAEPEMRIKTVKWALVSMPLFMIAYGWTIEKHVPVYWPIIMLFFLGASMIWIYTATLAYVVDANVGRSSSAVACNSLFRGVLAAVASQAATPILWGDSLTSGIGNGWFWSGMAILLILGEVSLVAVSLRGKAWREAYNRRQEEKEGAPEKMGR